VPSFSGIRPAENFPGASYTPEELEFILAMERFKCQKRRLFPTWHEVLQVVLSLGYRKVAPNTEGQP
jgi:hypothetical protein